MVSHKFVLAGVLILVVSSGVWLASSSSVRAPDTTSNTSSSTETSLATSTETVSQPPSQTPCFTLLDSAQDISVPFSCQVQVAPGEEPLTLSVSADGVVRIGGLNGPQLVLSENEEPFDAHVEVLGWEQKMLAPGAITFVDVTYDGYLDLQVLVYRAAYNESYRFYRYDPATKSFSIKLLLEATNPSIYKESRSIVEFHKGRGLADYYTETTYSLLGNEYVATRIEQQDLVDFDDDDSDYVRTISELRKGAMVEVSRVIIPREEIWGAIEE